MNLPCYLGGELLELPPELRDTRHLEDAQLVALANAATAAGWRKIGPWWCCPACGVRAIAAFAPSVGSAVAYAISRMRSDPDFFDVMDLTETAARLIAAHAELTGEPIERVKAHATMTTFGDRPSRRHAAETRRDELERQVERYRRSS